MSIKFEMKNESDQPATKNEDFSMELDKDRTEKSGEWARAICASPTTRRKT